MPQKVNLVCEQAILGVAPHLCSISLLLHAAGIVEPHQVVGYMGIGPMHLTMWSSSWSGFNGFTAAQNLGEVSVENYTYHFHIERNSYLPRSILSTPIGMQPNQTQVQHPTTLWMDGRTDGWIQRERYIELLCSMAFFLTLVAQVNVSLG